MSRFSKQDIIRFVEEQDVRFIRLQFTDIFGVLKNVAIVATELENVLENGCMFDGSSIDGFARIEESDMLLMPDPDTFTIFPWRPQQGKVARLICDVLTVDGKPFEGDPRFVLRRVLDEARAMGYTFNVGPECEFFLFNHDEQGQPTPNSSDTGGYFDLEPIGQGEDVRREIVFSLEDMGFQIEASHHEVAPGQHEIDFRFDEALKTADNVVTFKLAVKAIARRYGMHATFMPKPIEGINGSGMHINMSLFKDGINAFYDPDSPDKLSQTARQFVAGLLEHARGLSAVLNPLINSYKRLAPGFEAPCYIAWSAHNRSPLIRIPATRGNGTRVELRSPDPAGNPYMMLALCLAAGLDGIKKRLEPAAAFDGNIYNLTESERVAKGIASLPKSLGEALDEMEKDSLVHQVLGEHITENYLLAKRQEIGRYSQSITKWELDEYLKKY